MRKMAGLEWKSDSAATVIQPFLRGTGRIHLNGTGGVKFQNPDRNLDPGFFVDLASGTTHASHSEVATDLKICQ